MAHSGGSDTSRSQSAGLQLIDDLPRAETEALRAFTEIPGNVYQYNSLGRSRQKEENMVCDCQYEHGSDHPSSACGNGSDCINRLTQVECLEEECRCRSHCQNQRFQRKQYAQIEIVLTKMKGFGLRAAQDIIPDTFIYEYVGDVVSQPTFLKRMREYAEEGIKHFYFMMLQKEEYIDATKRGGIGRFANHSCNPNCYVAKWIVGPRVRMGIFAKRRILRGEELTFNYNVDRYGHDAQTCYCGEANCVGFIGGKTQTDIGGMDDLYIDALGIADDVEKLSLKGTQKKKGRKLDEDFVPILKPVDENEVPKVVAAVRQASHRRIIHKLLTRIRMTELEVVQRRLMRMHGFSIMAGILDDYSDDVEIVTLALESMSLWPLQSRNKVEDAKVEEPVARYTTSDNERLQVLSKELISRWAALESMYRIPKRALRQDEEEQDGAVGADSLLVTRIDDQDSPRPTKRLRLDDSSDIPVSTISIQPLGFRAAPSGLSGRSASSVASSSAPPLSHVAAPAPSAVSLPAVIRSELAAIIAQAAAAAASPTKDTKQPSASPPKSHRTHSKSSEASKTRSNDPSSREKRLSKLVSEAVVHCMSKYLSKHAVKLDHDDFKKHAKELTLLIAEKEKKSSSYQTSKLDKLSEEKQEKMKKFVKAYMAKILRKSKGRPPNRIVPAAHDSSGTPEDQMGSEQPDGSRFTNGNVHLSGFSLAQGDEVADVYASSDEDNPEGPESFALDTS